MNNGLHNLDDPDRYLEMLIERLFVARVEQAKNEISERIENQGGDTKKKIGVFIGNLEEKLESLLSQLEDRIVELVNHLNNIHEQGQSKVDSVGQRLIDELCQLRDYVHESGRQIEQDIKHQGQELIERVRAVEESVSMVLKRLDKIEADHDRAASTIQQEVVHVQGYIDDKLYAAIIKLVDTTSGLREEEHLHAKEAREAFMRMKWWVVISAVLATSAIITTMIILF